MSDIMLGISRLNDYANRIANVNSRVSRLDRRIRSLYNQFGLLDLWNLIRMDSLTSYSERLCRCQSHLEQTASDFSDAELAISNNFFSILNLKNTMASVIDAINFSNGFWTEEQKLIQLVFRYGMGSGLIGYGIAEPAKKSFWDGTLKFSDGDTSFSATPKYGSYKNKKAKRVIKQGKHSFIDNRPDDDFYNNRGTILEAKVDHKIEHSVLDENMGGDVGFAQGSLGLKLLSYEQFHSSASAGLYIFDKDGNKIFSPSVNAEIGTSVAYIQVDAEGRIGLGEDNKLLGLYGNVEAEALSAELKGKFSFIPGKEVYTGLNAEVTAAKISGSGGISVLGTDIGVTGGLKVGLGAHADVGFTDGKFKVDVGGAIGLGFDLGFEIDVSGTVDAVADIATDAWNGTVDFVSDVADGVGDFFSDVGKGIGNVGNNIADFLGF